ncbi:MAG: carboxypeptidase-like regulatory domain-containing protein [Terriglobales bacterium]
MSKIAAAALACLFSAGLASAWQYTPGPPSSSPTWGLGRGTSEPKREKPPEFRTLTGVVLDQADAPLKDAVVYLKNRKTKGVTTIIADANGAYRFPNLSRRADYEVYAEHKGQKSPAKTLSSLDSRTNAKINLYIETRQEEKQEAKQQEKKEAKEEKKEGK